MRSRTKSKLAKEMMKKVDEERYYCTKKDIEHWFKIINREIFGNTLPEFDKIEIRRRRGCWGECQGYVKKNGEKTSMVSLNHYHISKQHFIEVLAHECVHHYQWIYENIMDHGMSFSTWKTAFQKHNVNLRIFA